MSMSRKTSAGGCERASSSAASPPGASVGSKPATSSRVVATSLRMKGSSSTIRTEAIVSADDAGTDAFEGLVRDLVERLYHLRVELAARALGDRPARVRQRGGGPVGPVCGDRVERVGDREDPRRERDLLALQAVRVALAVPALVVVLDDVGRRLEEGDPAEDLRADQRVPAHQPALRVAERLGLVEDPVGDRDLADVVQQVAELDLGLAG